MEAFGELWIVLDGLEYLGDLFPQGGGRGEVEALGAIFRLDDGLLQFPSIGVDRFLDGLLAAALPAGATVIMASDHGNIEDGRTRQHTRNPVPTVFWGPRAAALAARVKRLTDIYPLVCALAAGNPAGLAKNRAGR